MKKSGVAGVQELQNEKAAFRSVDVDKSASHAMTISNRLAVDSTRYSSPELLQLLTPEFLKFKQIKCRSQELQKSPKTYGQNCSPDWLGRGWAAWRALLTQPLS